MDNSPQPGPDLPQGFAMGIKRIHHSVFSSVFPVVCGGAGVRKREMMQKYYGKNAEKLQKKYRNNTEMMQK